MAENTFDLSPVFSFPKHLSESEYRSLGEELRLGLVDFLDKEIEQLKALSDLGPVVNQVQELLALRGSMALLRLLPHSDKQGMGRIAVRSTVSLPNRPWLEDRLLVDIAGAFSRLEGRKSPAPLETPVRRYEVPTVATRKNNWWKWLAILPTAVSLAILLVLFSWINDLKAQYDDLTTSILLQKEQVLQAVEEGLEKGVEVGKLYDRLKEWVLEEDEATIDQAVDSAEELEE